MAHMFLRLSALWLFAFPMLAIAAVPLTPCGNLPGCSSGVVVPANVVVDNLSDIANFLILVAAALAVLFIVYAGFRMVISMGDESQITEQKNAVLYVLVGLLVVILAQMIVGFVVTQDYGQTGNPNDFFLNATASVVSIMLTLFNAAIVVMVIVGGAYMVHSQGKSDQFTKGKTIITWCIIGAVIANLSNALIEALLKLLNL